MTFIDRISAKFVKSGASLISLLDQWIRNYFDILDAAYGRRAIINPIAFLSPRHNEYLVTVLLKFLFPSKVIYITENIKLMIYFDYLFWLIEFAKHIN